MYRNVSKIQSAVVKEIEKLRDENKKQQLSKERVYNEVALYEPPIVEEPNEKDEESDVEELIVEEPKKEESKKEKPPIEAQISVDKDVLKKYYIIVSDHKNKTEMEKILESMIEPHKEHKISLSKLTKEFNLIKNKNIKITDYKIDNEILDKDKNKTTLKMDKIKKP